MKIAIIQFPGSSGGHETMLAVQRAEMQPIEFLWDESCDKLQEMDGYIIVGGSSSEDRSRSGVIAALDPVMKEIKTQSEKGKPVLGICNGAQILVEAGLVPGLENNKVAMMLAENKRVAHKKMLGIGFYDAVVHMRLSKDYQRNAFTRGLSLKDVLCLPVAHSEGRFVMTDALLAEVRLQGLNVFQYCDANGDIIEDFPVNPNGSMDNIAAISNKAGNVMAMMPHPEFAENGDAIFQSMRHYLADGRRTEIRAEHVIPLHYYPRRPVMRAYQRTNGHYEMVVGFVAVDHHALSVQKALRQLGIPVTVRRQLHWEIQCDSLDVLEQIKRSGVLLDEHQEVVMPTEVGTLTAGVLLVRPKDDVMGVQKLQTLREHFAVQGVQAIQSGVLWRYEILRGAQDDRSAGKGAQDEHGTPLKESVNILELADWIIHTNLLCHPCAHDCYLYDMTTNKGL